MQDFLIDVEKATLENTAFRQVLYTSQHLQLVLMSLKPGEEIGEEVHSTVDQFFRIEVGEGKVIMDGQEHAFKENDVFVVPAGIKHNVINTSASEALKLYTIYAPPHHKDQVIHHTKQDAQADTTDHL